MSYYIAKRNKKTGTFELLMKGEMPDQHYTLEDAIEIFKLYFHAEGHNNVKLLESVSLDVDITVKKAK